MRKRILIIHPQDLKKTMENLTNEEAGILFKLFIYAASGPKKGKLYKNEASPSPIGDKGLATLLDIEQDRWLEIRQSLFEKTCLCMDSAGAICIPQWDKYTTQWDKYQKKYVEKSKMSHLTEQVKDHRILKIIHEINSKFTRKLLLHQTFIEYFKILKKLDNVPNWNNMNFSKLTRPVIKLMTDIGPEDAFKLLEWSHEHKKFRWELTFLPKFYADYYKYNSVKQNDGYKEFK